MIKYDVQQIKEIVQEANNDIDEMRDYIEKFKYLTNDFFEYNTDEIYFPKLENKMQSIINALDDFVIEDIQHLFNYIDVAADKMEYIDDAIKKGLDQE